MQRNAAVGTALGGAAGAIIGHQSDHAAEGALIGAATGGLTGGLIGDAQDARAERDAAIAQVSHTQQVPGLVNLDLINMAQSGLSDEVIINAIQQRGGQFDLSPAGLIALKSHGVSDAVIAAVQRSSSPTASGAVLVRPVHGVVVAAPRPVAKVIIPASRRTPHYIGRRRRW